MKVFHLFTGILVLGIMAASCSSHTTAQSNPTDSSATNGTAPATYIPDSPASNPNSEKNSSMDTGIKAAQDTMHSNNTPAQ